MMQIVIYDIETLKSFFLCCVYIPKIDMNMSFQVNKNTNQLDELLKFLEDYQHYYFVSYNGLRFDSQIIEFIIRNHQHWQELGWEEICELIYQKAKDTIDDANYDVFPEYKECDLSVKQLDLFLIWNFDNQARRTSLKAVEFAIDFENIEELPQHLIHKGELTDEEIQQITLYCFNDVRATYELYKITIGETELPLYKGKNKIADRIAIEEEIGLRCLNFDDVKIGAEWNKLDYVKLTGTWENALKPKKINHFYGRRYKQFFPKTVEFQTPELKKFVNKIGEAFVLNMKQDFVYKFNDNLSVNIGRGGIHSQEKARMIVAKEDEIYLQCDIGSQYPNAVRKYKIEPAHLPGWNGLIVDKIARRLNYKALAKSTKNPKYESLQEMGKLALNGGSCGRLNTKGDWQEDPCCFLRITMGCQLEILMIVEALLLKDFNVVSVNTDGFDVIVKREREEEFKELCTFYENKIGNSELGNIEYTEFLWIAQTSVSDYIAMKPNGETKKKGDFTTDFELHKNKSAAIIPIALECYFVGSCNIDRTIRNHSNVYDFCIRQKASKDFHYEGIKDGITTVYNKLIRYYVSNAGEKVWKVKNPECITNAPSRSQVEAGDWKCTVCNYLPKSTKVEDCDINFSYYIDKAEDIIYKIDRRYQRKRMEDKQQLTILW